MFTQIAIYVHCVVLGGTNSLSPFVLSYPHTHTHTHTYWCMRNIFLNISLALLLCLTDSARKIPTHMRQSTTSRKEGPRSAHRRIKRGALGINITGSCTNATDPST
jgi:hypothetical protein